MSELSCSCFAAIALSVIARVLCLNANILTLRLQHEMASLLAGLAAAEKIQTGAPSDPASSAAVLKKSKRLSKSSTKTRKSREAETGGN